MPQYDKPSVIPGQPHFGGTGLHDDDEYGDDDSDEDEKRLVACGNSFYGTSYCKIQKLKLLTK